MPENASSEAFIQLNLGSDGGDVTIKTGNDLKIFVETEHNEWQWLTKLNTPCGHATRERIYQHIASMQGSMNPLINASPAERWQRRDDARRVLQDIFTTKLRYSGGKTAALIRKIRERKGDAYAAYAASFAHGLCTADSPDFVRAGFDIVLFERGMVDNDIEKESLKRTQETWNEFSKSAANEITGHKSQYITLAGQMREQLEQKGAAADKQREEHGKAMKAIEQKFTDEMAVKSAVAYWTDKEKEHTKAAGDFVSKIKWVSAAGVAAIVVVMLLATSPVDAVKTLLDAGKLDESAASSVMTATWVSNVSRLAIVLLLFVWPARILVRNYLSNVHLATDAGERRVIIQTNLAMLADPDLKAHDDLKKRVLPHALKHIFRHSPTGMPADAMPTPGLLGLWKAGKGE